MARTEAIELLQEAFEFIQCLRNSSSDEAIDLLTNNPGEDIEERLKTFLVSNP